MPRVIASPSPSQRTRQLILDLVRAFHGEDSHSLSSQASVPSNTSWLAKSTALCSSLRLFRVIGYAVLCFGYSVERGGRGVFLDDFYIIPSERGRSGALCHGCADRLCVETGCVAMHLEVVAGNRAENFYRRLSFRDRGSALLTLRPLGVHKEVVSQRRTGDEKGALAR
jgi:hypothetical protein